jgi:hypothetical protein
MLSRLRHPLLKNPDVRRRFVACESPASRAAIRGGPIRGDSAAAEVTVRGGGFLSEEVR